MKGQRVLITGVSGLMAQPIALELARENEVFGVARFNDQAAKARLEAAGVHTIVKDIGDPTLDGVPGDVDYVLHCGAILNPVAERDRRYTFEVNVQATGRLMKHCRSTKGFLFCSSGSAYEFQGQRPLREDDPYGLHVGSYSATKIAGESLVEFLAREWSIPSISIRICSLYGPLGGAPTNRVEQVVAGQEIVLYPDRPNNYNPMYESDYVEKAIAAVQLAAVPPVVVNFAGSETMSAEDYCSYAGELVGKPARFRFSATESYWPLWADVTKMHEILGPTKVSVRDGIRNVLEIRHPELLGAVR